MGPQSKEDLGHAMQVAKVSTVSVGCFQECFLKEKVYLGLWQEEQVSTQKKKQLELL